MALHTERITLNRAAMKNDVKEMKGARSSLTFVCTTLACICANWNLKLRRRSLLTALSLEPRKDVFRAVYRLYTVYRKPKPGLRKFMMPPTATGMKAGPLTMELENMMRSGELDEQEQSSRTSSPAPVNVVPNTVQAIIRLLDVVRAHELNPNLPWSRLKYSCVKYLHKNRISFILKEEGVNDDDFDYLEEDDSMLFATNYTAPQQPNTHPAHQPPAATVPKVAPPVAARSVASGPQSPYVTKHSSSHYTHTNPTHNITASQKATQALRCLGVPPPAHRPNTVASRPLSQHLPHTTVQSNVTATGGVSRLPVSSTVSATSSSAALDMTNKTALSMVTHTKTVNSVATISSAVIQKPKQHVSRPLLHQQNSNSDIRKAEALSKEFLQSRMKELLDKSVKDGMKGVPDHNEIALPIMTSENFVNVNTSTMSTNQHPGVSSAPELIQKAKNDLQASMPSVSGLAHKKEVTITNVAGAPLKPSDRQAIANAVISALSNAGVVNTVASVPVTMDTTPLNSATSASVTMDTIPPSSSTQVHSKTATSIMTALTDVPALVTDVSVTRAPVAETVSSVPVSVSSPLKVLQEASTKPAANEPVSSHKVVAPAALGVSSHKVAAGVGSHQVAEARVSSHKVTTGVGSHKLAEVSSHMVVGVSSHKVAETGVSSHKVAAVGVGSHKVAEVRMSSHKVAPVGVSSHKVTVSSHNVAAGVSSHKVAGVSSHKVAAGVSSHKVAGVSSHKVAAGVSSHKVAAAGVSNQSVAKFVDSKGLIKTVKMIRTLHPSNQNKSGVTQTKSGKTIAILSPKTVKVLAGQSSTVKSSHKEFEQTSATATPKLATTKRQISQVKLPNLLPKGNGRIAGSPSGTSSVLSVKPPTTGSILVSQQAHLVAANTQVAAANTQLFAANQRILSPIRVQAPILAPNLVQTSSPLLHSSPQLLQPSTLIEANQLVAGPTQLVTQNVEGQIQTIMTSPPRPTRLHVEMPVQSMAPMLLSPSASSSNGGLYLFVPHMQTIVTSMGAQPQSVIRQTASMTSTGLQGITALTQQVAAQSVTPQQMAPAVMPPAQITPPLQVTTPGIPHPQLTAAAMPPQQVAAAVSPELQLQLAGQPQQIMLSPQYMPAQPTAAQQLVQHANLTHQPEQLVFQQIAASTPLSAHTEVGLTQLEQPQTSQLSTPVVGSMQQMESSLDPLHSQVHAITQQPRTQLLDASLTAQISIDQQADLGQTILDVGQQQLPITPQTMDISQQPNFAASHTLPPIQVSHAQFGAQALQDMLQRSQLNIRGQSSGPCSCGQELATCQCCPSKGASTMESVFSTMTPVGQEGFLSDDGGAHNADLMQAFGAGVLDGFGGDLDSQSGGLESHSELGDVEAAYTQIEQAPGNDTAAQSVVVPSPADETPVPAGVGPVDESPVPANEVSAVVEEVRFLVDQTLAPVNDVLAAANDTSAPVPQDISQQYVMNSNVEIEAAPGQIQAFGDIHVSENEQTEINQTQSAIHDGKFSIADQHEKSKVLFRDNLAKLMSTVTSRVAAKKAKRDQEKLTSHSEIPAVSGESEEGDNKEVRKEHTYTQLSSINDSGYLDTSITTTQAQPSDVNLLAPSDVISIPAYEVGDGKQAIMQKSEDVATDLAETAEMSESDTADLTETEEMSESDTADLTGTEEMLQSVSAHLNEIAETSGFATAELTETAETLESATVELTETAETSQAATAELNETAETLQSATAELTETAEMSASVTADLTKTAEMCHRGAGRVQSTVLPVTTGEVESAMHHGTISEAQSILLSGTTGEVESAMLSGYAGEVQCTVLPGTTGEVQSAMHHGTASEAKSIVLSGTTCEVQSAVLPGTACGVQSAMHHGNAGEVQSAMQPGTANEIETAVLPVSASETESAMLSATHANEGPDLECSEHLDSDSDVGFSPGVHDKVDDKDADDAHEKQKRYLSHLPSGTIEKTGEIVINEHKSVIPESQKGISRLNIQTDKSDTRVLSQTVQNQQKPQAVTQSQSTKRLLPVLSTSAQNQTMETSPTTQDTVFPKYSSVVATQKPQPKDYTRIPRNKTPPNVILSQASISKATVTSYQASMRSKSPIIVPQASVRSKSPIIVPQASVRSKSPIIVPQSSVRSKSPIIVPQASVRSKSPIIVPQASVRSKSPVIAPQTSVRSRSPIIAPQTSVRSKSPIIAPQTSARNMSPITSSQGSVRGKKSVTSPQGSLTSKSPVTSPQALVRSKSPISPICSRPPLLHRSKSPVLPFRSKSPGLPFRSKSPISAVEDSPLKSVEENKKILEECLKIVEANPESDFSQLQGKFVSVLQDKFAQLNGQRPREEKTARPNFTVSSDLNSLTITIGGGPGKNPMKIQLMQSMPSNQNLSNNALVRTVKVDSGHKEPPKQQPQISKKNLLSTAGTEHGIFAVRTHKIYPPAASTLSSISPKPKITMAASAFYRGENLTPKFVREGEPKFVQDPGEMKAEKGDKLSVEEKKFVVNKGNISKMPTVESDQSKVVVTSKVENQTLIKGVHTPDKVNKEEEEEDSTTLRGTRSQKMRQLSGEQNSDNKQKPVTTKRETKDSVRKGSRSSERGRRSMSSESEQCVLKTRSAKQVTNDSESMSHSKQVEIFSDYPCTRTRSSSARTSESPKDSKGRRSTEETRPEREREKSEERESPKRQTRSGNSREPSLTRETRNRSKSEKRSDSPSPTNDRSSRWKSNHQIEASGTRTRHQSTEEKPSPKSMAAGKHGKRGRPRKEDKSTPDRDCSITAKDNCTAGKDPTDSRTLRHRRSAASYTEVDDLFIESDEESSTPPKKVRKRQVSRDSTGSRDSKGSNASQSIKSKSNTISKKKSKTKEVETISDDDGDDDDTMDSQFEDNLTKSSGSGSGFAAAFESFVKNDSGNDDDFNEIAHAATYGASAKSGTSAKTGNLDRIKELMSVKKVYHSVTPTLGERHSPPLTPSNVTEDGTSKGYTIIVKEIRKKAPSTFETDHSTSKMPVKTEPKRRTCYSQPNVVSNVSTSPNSSNSVHKPVYANRSTEVPKENPGYESEFQKFAANPPADSESDMDDGGLGFQRAFKDWFVGKSYGKKGKHGQESEASPQPKISSAEKAFMDVVSQDKKSKMRKSNIDSDSDTPDSVCSSTNTYVKKSENKDLSSISSTEKMETSDMGLNDESTNDSKPSDESRTKSKDTQEKRSPSPPVIVAVRRTRSDKVKDVHSVTQRRAIKEVEPVTPRTRASLSRDSSNSSTTSKQRSETKNKRRASDIPVGDDIKSRRCSLDIPSTYRSSRSSTKTAANRTRSAGTSLPIAADRNRSLSERNRRQSVGKTPTPWESEFLKSLR